MLGSDICPRKVLSLSSCAWQVYGDIPNLGVPHWGGYDKDLIVFWDVY